MIRTNDSTVAAAALIAGDLVAIPTETVYGLGADATNDAAVKKIFAVKGRPESHPLIVHVYSIDDITPLVTSVPSSASLLCEKFWPGPLTVVLQRQSSICDAAAGGHATIALRCPSHPLTRELLRRSGRPIAAPSANLFGHVSPTTADHVIADLGEAVSVVLDGGPCEVGLESTIVDCTVNPVAILRSGAITAEQIQAVLGNVNGISDTPAPGTLESHYAPRCEVRLVDDLTKAKQLIAELNERGIVSRLVDYEDRLEEFAHNLYADLRKCDDDNIAVAVVVLPVAHGIGLAIRDRLFRAASGS